MFFFLLQKQKFKTLASQIQSSAYYDIFRQSSQKIFGNSKINNIIFFSYMKKYACE